MRIIVLFFLFIILSFNVFSQENIKSNYEVMDSISNECVNSLILYIKNTKELKTFHLEINDLIKNGSSNLFENKIIKSLSSNKILSKKDSTEYQVSFRIEEFSVKYERYESNPDSLFRIIRLLALSIIDNGKTKNKISECNCEYRDLVSRDDFDFVERTTHPFAKAPIPERKKNFFESILQPAIYVSTALITVIILFTVRSN
jgi:hypothetical protein